MEVLVHGALRRAGILPKWMTLWRILAYLVAITVAVGRLWNIVALENKFFRRRWIVLAKVRVPARNVASPLLQLLLLQPSRW